MINERSIINGLILLASCLLVPFLIFSTLTIAYGPALILGGLLFLALCFFGIKDRLCVGPMIGGSVSGSLAFLPLPLNAVNIACLFLVLYYCTGYIAIRQKPIRLGKRQLLLPIAIITLIVLYHNHSFAIKSFGTGGEVEGERPAYLIYLGVVAYFCGINVSAPSVAFLRNLPRWIIFFAILSAFPFLLSTYIPSLAPALSMVTSEINVQAYIDTQAGGSDSGDVGRFAVFGNIALVVQLFLLCYYPIGTWWRPNRWWVLGLSILCLSFATLSGYRNVLFGYFFLIVIAAWCHHSWRSIVIPCGLAILVLVILIASADRLIYLPTERLPMIAQRSLSFLPGDWSPDAMESAKSSNEFRKNIIDVYMKEYFFNSPVFGNGFGIDTVEFNDLSAGLGRQDPESNQYRQAKLFIVGKMYHTGWLSLYDIVGSVGFVAFVWLGLVEIWMAGRFIYGPKSKRKSPLFPLHVWNFVNITTAMISYFTVFGDFQATFISLCTYGIVLSQLDDVENRTEIPELTPLPAGKTDFPVLKGYPSRY